LWGADYCSKPKQVYRAQQPQWFVAIRWETSEVPEETTQFQTKDGDMTMEET